MKNYFLKRILIACLTLFAILFVLFILMDLLPGSPFNDEKLSAEQIEKQRVLYGLDKPWPIKFANYVRNMLTGNFGISYTIAKNIPVADLLETKLPVSLRIGLQAVALGTALGLVLGIISAVKHNTVWDYIATFLSVIGVSIPSYVFALGLSFFVGFKLGLAPMLYKQQEALASSVLPTISLSLFTMASIARFTRTEILEIMDSDYVLLAESKGVTGLKLIYNHVIRNALISIITVLAPLIVGLMTGSMVIEKIFSVPGIGQLLITAIQSNDYNVIVVLSFIYSSMYIGIMLLVDILYGVIDPRIRLAKEEQND